VYNFFENFNVSESKFEQIIYNYLKLATKDNTSMIMNLERFRCYDDLKIFVININLPTLIIYKNVKIK